jgi:uncharacterized protein (DUF1778 family)
MPTTATKRAENRARGFRRAFRVDAETKQMVERDLEVFFDALIYPPQPHERLRRAFKAAERVAV